MSFLDLIRAKTKEEEKKKPLTVSEKKQADSFLSILQRAKQQQAIPSVERLNIQPTPTTVKPSIFSKIAKSVSGVPDLVKWGTQNPRLVAKELPSTLADFTYIPVTRLSGNIISSLANQELSPSSLGKTGEVIFGKEKLKPYTTQGQEFASSFGVKNPLGVAGLAVGSIGLDFTNALVGGGKSKIAKEMVKATTVDAVNAVAKKYGMELSDDTAKVLAKTTDPTEIKTIVDSIAPKVPTMTQEALTPKVETPLESKLAKAIQEKEAYAKANSQYLAPDANSFTPNVAGRANAKMNRMDVTMDKYSRLYDNVENLKKKVADEKAGIEYKAKAGERATERATVDEHIFNIGDNVETGNAGEFSTAKITKINKNSYQFEYPNGDKSSMDKRLMNRWNEEKIKAKVETPQIPKESFKTAAEFVDNKLPVKMRYASPKLKGGQVSSFSKNIDEGVWKDNIRGTVIENNAKNKSLIAELDKLGEQGNEPASKIVKSLFDDEYAFQRNVNLTTDQKAIFSKLDELGIAEKTKIQNPWNKTSKEDWEVWKLKDEFKKSFEKSPSPIQGVKINPLIEEPKKYKTKEEFIKAETKKQLLGEKATANVYGDKYFTLREKAKNNIRTTEPVGTLGEMFKTDKLQKIIGDAKDLPVFVVKDVDFNGRFVTEGFPRIEISGNALHKFDQTLLEEAIHASQYLKGRITKRGVSTNYATDINENIAKNASQNIETILTQEKLKTKSQLSEIYKQAKSPSPIQEVPKVETPTFLSKVDEGIKSSAQTPKQVELPKTAPVEIPPTKPTQQEQFNSLLGSKERGFIQHAEKENIVPAEALSILDKNYTPQSSIELYAKAKTFVNDFPDLAEKTLASKRDDTVAQSIRMAMMEKFGKEGQTSRAVDMIESEARLATEKGREVQLYSMLNRTTPEGMGMFLQRQFDIAKELNPKLDLKITESEYKTLYNSMKDIQKISDEYTRTFETAKLVKSFLDKIPSSMVSKISTLQTMAQLLNPKTIIRNLGGNAMFATLENVSQVVATPIDKFLSIFTGKRTTTLPNLKTQGSGFISGLKKGFEETKAGVQLGANTQFDLPRSQVFRGKILGGLEKTMNFALRATDKAAYTSAFDDTMKGLLKTGKATEKEALELANYKGLYRTFQDDNATTKVFSGLKNVLNEIGVKDASGNKFGLGDFVLKYSKTSANFLNRGLAYTHAGFVRTIFKASEPLFGKKFNQEAFVSSFSRAFTGTTGLVGIGATLAGLGIITPSPSKDKDIRGFQKITGAGNYQINASALKRFVATGFNADSAKMREGDTLVSYDWAQPLAMPLSIGANMALTKEKTTTGKTLDATSAFLNSLETGISTVQEQPLVTGIKKLFGGSDLMTGAKEVAKSSLSSFVPTLFKQFNDVIDNTTRETYDPSSIKQAYNLAITKIPFLASKLEPRKTVFGENQEKYLDGTNSIFNVFFNPAFVSKFKKDPETKLIMDIYEQTGETKQFPRVVDKKIKINGEEKILSVEEFNKFQEYVGQRTKQELATKAKEEYFRELTPENQANELSNVMTDIQKEAKVLLFGENKAWDTQEITEQKNIEKMKPVFDKILKLSKERQYKEVNKIISELSIDEQKALKQVKTSVKSRETAEMKDKYGEKVKQVVNKFKLLYSEKKYKEANALLDNLSEDELIVFKGMYQ